MPQSTRPSAPNKHKSEDGGGGVLPKALVLPEGEIKFNSSMSMAAEAYIFLPLMLMLRPKPPQMEIHQTTYNTKAPGILHPCQESRFVESGYKFLFGQSLTLHAPISILTEIPWSLVTSLQVWCDTMLQGVLTVRRLVQKNCRVCSVHGDVNEIS